MGKLVKIAKISAFSLAAFLIVALLGLSLPFGGRRTFSVQTGSMEPAIKAGSLVLVNSIPVSQLEKGDVITYINPDNNKQTITHRVVQVLGLENGPKQIITKGDANAAIDQPVSENIIVGKADRVVPYAGRVIDFVRTIPGLILLIYLPALLIVIHELRRLSAYYRTKVPYVLAGYQHHSQSSGRPLNVVIIFILLSVIATVAIVPRTFAAFKATATLTGNTISSSGVPVPPPTNSCTVNNSTSVNVNVSSNQSASSGSASSSNNTTTSNVSSGNANNNSSTSVTINSSNSSTTCQTPQT